MSDPEAANDDAAAAPEVSATGLRTSDSRGASRISATVGGHEIFFESDDIELTAAPEVFASALLPATVQHGSRLHIDQPLDRRWLRNVQGVIDVWTGWWGVAPRLGDHLRAPRWLVPRPRGRRAGEVGLCFSLGVDSFFSLVSAPRRFDTLILCEGFDIALGDRARMDAATAAVRAVADARGLDLVVLRTNLRQHRPVKGSGWGRTHGGALAALGHACRGRLGELVISSTYHVSQDEPWGSHWDTDHGWSSALLEVSHYGERYTRHEKVAAILGDPLAKRHLRVCWENRASAGNCGECEKCCRTLLQIQVLGGRLEDWPFAGSGSLASRLDAVASVHPYQIPAYATMLPALRSEPELTAAVEALIGRARDPWEVRGERLRRRNERRAQVS